MCERVSGFARDRFRIDRIARNKVYVTVTSGADGAVTAAFPAYPSPWEGQANPYVVLDIVRITGADPDDYDPYQHFLPLLECPRLFRGVDGEWQTEQEALADSPKSQTQEPRQPTLRPSEGETL